MTSSKRFLIASLAALLIAGWGCDPSLTDGLIRPTTPLASPGNALPDGSRSTVSTGGVHGGFQFQAGHRDAKIPFQIVDQQLLITARLNGRREVRLLLDTAFGMNGVLLLRPELGRELDLSYQGKVALGGGGSRDLRDADMAGGGHLELPGVTFRDLPILVMRSAPGEDLEYDGIIGDSLFDGLLEIDFDNRWIRLSTFGSTIGSEWGLGLPISFAFGIPAVEASLSLAGRDLVPVKLMLDTGADHPLYLFTQARPEFAPPRGSVQIHATGFSGPLSYRLGRTSRLTLGGYSLVQPLTGFLDPAAAGSAGPLGQDGFIGLQGLRQFRLLIDYAGQRLYLRPGRDYGSPTGFNMAGLVMSTSSGGHKTVRHVLEGSPADLADIRTGDLIMSIDGSPVSRHTEDQLAHLFLEKGRRLQLELRRGQARLKTHLTLKPLI